MGRLLILLIHVYQAVVSPMIGPHCRFYPSCSEYTIQAIERYGFFKGIYLGARRLSRCHPWNPGGLDPVPPRKQ